MNASIKTFEIGIEPDVVADALEKRRLPEQLIRPLQALTSSILTRVAKGPVSLYVASRDDERATRNRFAALLAKVLARNVPDTILVDCDFVETGLSGIVPQRDALGFVDLLLYGSSLDVVRQKSRHDINVIGAGSFPVGKKSPVVMEAFDATKRYIASHMKCTIFCGPALDDDDAPHPMFSHVDLPLIVAVGRRRHPARLDELETMIAASAERLVAVRLALDPRAPVPPPEEKKGEKVPTPEDEYIVPLEDIADEVPPKPPAEPSKPRAEQPRRQAKAPKRRAEAAPPADDSDAPVWRETKEKEPSRPRRPDEDTVELEAVVTQAPSGGSVLPRVITTVLAVAFIAFLFWWLYWTKPLREGDAGEERTPVAAAQREPTPAAENPDEGAADLTPAAVDSVPATTSGTPARTPAPSQPTTPAPGSAEVSPGTLAAADIIVTDDLRQYRGKYALHVSSFRRLDDARNDAYYLNDRGYPIIIANVDLGSKGKWFRVYVGPFDDQEHALEEKIKLDDIPRVKFTRITKLPG